MACLGSDQACGHVREQRRLQMQIPWPRVRDLIINLGARQMCGTCLMERTPWTEHKSSVSPAKEEVGDVLQGGTFHLWALEPEAMQLPGGRGEPGVAAAPSCSRGVLPPQQGICSSPCFKVLFTAFTRNYKR